MLRSCLRRLGFSLVTLRRLPGSRSPEQEIRPLSDADDVLEKTMRWWRDDLYTRIPRRRELRWRGRTLLRWRYFETPEAYFSDASGVVAVISEMQRAGIIPPLGPESRVFEPGCNVGKNLYYLQNAFGCAVSGLDISASAIELAKRKIWEGRSRYDFVVANALTTDYFSRLEDNAFDLALTYWHLVHIPRSPAKTAYVRTLKRVSRCFVAFEPVDPKGKHDTLVAWDGQYCLSWDDWAAEYGLVEYPIPDPSRLNNPATRVYYAVTR